MVKIDKYVKRRRGYGFNSSDDIYFYYVIPECECNKGKMTWSEANLFWKVKDKKHKAYGKVKEYASHHELLHKIKNRMERIITDVMTREEILDQFIDYDREDVENVLEWLTVDLPKYDIIRFSEGVIDD